MKLDTHRGNGVVERDLLERGLVGGNVDKIQLSLVPMPRQVNFYPGRFAVRSGQYIVLGTADARMMLASAQRLRDVVRQECGVALQIAVGHYGDASAIAVELRVDPRKVRSEQGYVLDIDEVGITIAGHDVEGVFYGVCTLNQLVRQFGADIPAMTIADHPDFPARGVMLDVSRSKVPTLETLYSLVDLLAGLKINQVQLYLEHTFEYRDHPEAWMGVCPITGQDILELDAFCRERFIDLVPNQNSLGHLSPWLEHPKYNHLAEAPDGFEWPWGGRSDGPFSLNPTDPGSFELLSSLYDDLLPHFQSELFNVGCDETFDVGQGRNKEICEERGVHRVYLDFLLEIYKLVRARRRKMMFWGDIIIHEPELIPELPKDVIALEWGYERDHPFAEHCEAFASAGVPFYVCPGTSTWNALTGRTDNAMGNLRSAAENGLKHGAIGYLNTDWGDRGHWQYLPMSYLGFAYGAAVSWAYEANAGIDLPVALGVQVFDDPSGRMGQLAFDLGNVYRIYERMASDRIHNTNFLASVLYQPVRELSGGRLDWGRIPSDVFQTARQEIDAVMAGMSQTRMRGSEASLVRREYENAARLSRHACRLGELKIALAEQSVSATRRGELADEADALAEDMRQILAEHRVIWLARNRVGGLEEGSGKHFQKMIEDYRAISAEMRT